MTRKTKMLIGLGSLVLLSAGSVIVLKALPIYQKISAPVDARLDPAFHKSNLDRLFSDDKLLGAVGVSPADPTRVPSPHLEKSIVDEIGKPPKSCPTPIGRDGRTKGHTEIGPSGEPIEPKQAHDDVGPLIVTPDGSRTKEVSAAEDGEITSPAAPLNKERPASKTPAESTKTSLHAPTPSQTKVEKSRVPAAETDILTKEPFGRPDDKQERFQLPGSLKITIPSYSGVQSKWALMLILDDSGTMAKKGRLWRTNRSHAAQEFIQNLSGALPPGSKLAVRNFLCQKGQDGKPCPANMLLDWCAPPYPKLTEKMKASEPAGKTNPCAAAAYSIKTDFSKISGLEPRLLLLTDGASKCSFNDVAAASKQNEASGDFRVDVVGFGMRKKSSAGYGNLTERTGGMFIKVARPEDAAAAAQKYSKALATKTYEHIEVKGEKEHYKVKPDGSITLVPGTYTATLPPIPGLDKKKRVIPKITINAGESKTLEIKINKGRAVVKEIK